MSDDDTSPKPREKPLNELLSNSLVDIYTGPESTHWVLHEKLLCHHSAFFARTFYNQKNQTASSKTFGIEECDDLPFELLVGWLYSKALRYPEEEKDIGPLLDLYFLAERFEMSKLEEDVTETVRAFYHSHETYPALRRVQYVYANTEDDNVMREMMVSSVARYLTLSNTMPPQWEKALKKNGQMAVDIIRSIQTWHLESRAVPDARDASQDRGRKIGFSGVDEGSTMSSIKEEDSESKVNGSS